MFKNLSFLFIKNILHYLRLFSLRNLELKFYDFLSYE